MRMKKAVFVLVVVSLMINLCGCAHTNPDEGYMLIRIHIRADSNSAADQGVKLKVRDAVTAYLEASTTTRRLTPASRSGWTP